jgi:hypothetical protein
MESVTVINFKKVVSMAVVLSLMLGACGKNPARRDGEMTDEKADALTQKTSGGSGSTDEETLGGTVAGALGGTVVGALGGAVGTAIVLTIVNVAWACFGKSKCLFSVKLIARNSLVFGASGAAGVGGASRWIYGKMSRAAGDGWKKVMLNTGILGLVGGGGTGLAIAAIMIRNRIALNALKNM